MFSNSHINETFYLADSPLSEILLPLSDTDTIIGPECLFWITGLKV